MLHAVSYLLLDLAALNGLMHVVEFLHVVMGHYRPLAMAIPRSSNGNKPIGPNVARAMDGNTLIA
ncbi:hypothetical protein H257_10152 [Aphanomyces astaci]|uniref:Very-long-chain (3R)-3-hydroxyacyl-CoA dehydratase n=1 Tax=Aphanomyces astaci TaxID=112090 RepID=W4G7U8_APHAT|nr:hypothetical protein H257_10152 [Aphanomyces astaci]ETV75782.1 hypothetical protein H257_10152 [Aphanomyces astaci]|eukprot:XP_009834913.1 hypothetical protein H257_10152 [Aphanomyces astaci]